MSLRWSNVHTWAEHRDIEANVMAMHKTGQYVALSDHMMIYIIDIDSPTKIVRKVHRVSKYDVVASEWNPIQQNLLALGYNQTIAVYSLEDLTPSVSRNDNTISRSQEPTLLIKGHRRNITDLNWAPTDGNLIATASIDTFAHIWDLKDTRKPIISFSSIVGPSHVKWCKADANILATSLEGDIRIWDKRKGNIPTHYISAHEQQINGLDWAPTPKFRLATCSQDRTVKFWDISKSGESKLESILSTKLPVWRAKHTPFGNGLISVVVPQLRRTGDINSLWLWNTNNFGQPVHSFFGPTDVVIDFAWRWTTHLSRAELVTWSKDRTFRIWSVDRNILSLLNDNEPTIFKSNEERFRRIIFCNTLNINQDHHSSISEEDADKRRPILSQLPSSNLVPKLKSPDHAKENKDNQHKSTFIPSRTVDYKPSLEPITSSLITKVSLEDELAVMNLNIPNLLFEDINLIKKHCIVSAYSLMPGFSFKLKISFPPAYPNNVTPIFEFLDEDGDKGRIEKNYLSELRMGLLQLLQSTAEDQVKRNRPCLEPCLRAFVSTLKKRTSFYPANSQLAIINYSSLYGSFHDASVPFPKISGGRFGSNNFLVCFGKLPYLKTMHNNNQCTPRALSDLSAYLQTNYRPFLSSIETQEFNRKDSFEISSYPYYCYIERKSRRPPLRNSSFRNNKCGPIVIYTCDMMPCNRSLAENYIFDNKDKVEMCRINAAVAAKENRKDLQQAWTLAMLSVNPKLSNEDNDSMDIPWAKHPFGKKLINSLIDFYLNLLGDIQMAAMLSCVSSRWCEICSKMPCSIYNHRKISESSMTKLVSDTNL